MSPKRPISSRLSRAKRQPEPEPEAGIEVREDSLAAQVAGEEVTFNERIQQLVTAAPWLGIALAFHVIVLLIFGAVVMSQPIRGADEVKTIRLPFKKLTPLEMELPQDIIDNENLPKETPADIDPVWKIAEDADHSESADNEDWHEDKGDSYEFLSDKPLKGRGVYDMIGLGGGGGGDYGGPRGGRRNLVGEGGGGQPTDSAVLAGLMWLARHQNPDGSWGAKSFQNQCTGTKCSGVGSMDDIDIGLTGLASLAFTGATYSPGSKKDVYGGICFGDVVRKAALYLKDIQKEDGAFGNPSTDSKFMYNHAVAAYALADLVALMKDKGEVVGTSLFKRAAQKGIDYLVSAQNPGKAWRYTPKCGDNDVSVTGWCAMALKAAEEGDLNVPETVWDGIQSHLDDVTEPAYGQVGYIEKNSYSVLSKVEEELIARGKMAYPPPSLTAVGIMMRIFMGEKSSSTIMKKGAAKLMGNLPTWNPDNRGKIDYYYWFYASYGLNQYDGPKGPCWSKWNEKMKEVLLKHQKTPQDGCANGSWDTLDRWSEEAGRVYATAINVLTLEVYYRLRIVLGTH